MIAERHVPDEVPQRRLLVDIAPFGVDLTVVPRIYTCRVDVVARRLYPRWMVGVGPDRHRRSHSLLVVKNSKELHSPVANKHHLQRIARRPCTS